MFKPPFNWFNKFGTLPETYKEAMSYEEQIMWLCKEVKRNESYAEEFQAEIDQINESISKLDSDIDDVYRNLNNLATNKENRLVQGTGILLHRIEPIGGTPTVNISTSPIDVSEYLISGSYIPLADKEIGDVIDLTPVTSPNTAYFMKYVEAGEIFEIVGNCDIAKINASNEITLIQKNLQGISFDEPVTFETLYYGTLIISFNNTDSNVPEIREFITSDYIFDEINKKQERLIAGSGISINGNVISATGSGDDYVNISSLLKQNQYIDFSNKTIGDTLSLEPVSANNTAYYIKEVVLGEEFKIVGNYILSEIDSNNAIVNKESGTATSQNPYIYTCSANLPSKARFVITFENTNTNQPSISDNIDQYYTFNNIEGGKRINKFKEDLYLNNSTPNTGLIDGLYFTGDYHIYVNGTKNDRYDKALILVDGSTIYAIASPYNNHTNQAYSLLYYSNNSWNVGQFFIDTEWSKVISRPSLDNFTQDLNLVNGTGTTGLANGLYYTGNYHVKINGEESSYFNQALILAEANNVLYVIASPTNNHLHYAYYTVYYNSTTGTWNNGYSDIRSDWSQIDNKPSINNFTQDLNLVDGTGTTGLANGLYYTGNYHVNINGVQSVYFDKAFILADTNDSLYVIASPYNNHENLAYYVVYYNSQTASWSYGFKSIRTNWSLIDDKPAIATTISSSSTNNEIAGAKAVYDLTSKYIDVTSQYTFTPSTNIVVNAFKIFKCGEKLYSLILDLGRSSGYFNREELLGTINCLPVDTFYGAGRSVHDPGGSSAKPYSASGMILSDGRVRAYYDGTDSIATNIQIWFIKAD